MAAIRDRLATTVGRALRDMPPQRRLHVAAMLAIFALYLGHLLLWCWPQPFFIEDAAITFAYARNWISGDGLVPYVGGERVEGYSNPTWTALIGLLYGVGIEPWLSSKVMGALLGLGTLVLSYGLARACAPDDDDHSPLLAPLLLAASTQFVHWSVAGLENPLFNFLFAAGTYALLHEIRSGSRAPWSALLMFGLTATRPDGIAYAAILGGTRVVTAIMYRQWAALLAWPLAFGLPYGLYNWWRYEYFAWWFPNTYYAKQKAFQPFVWTSGGWDYVRKYMTIYGVVYAAPLFALALVGAERWWKRILIGAAMAWLAVILLWDGKLELLPVAYRAQWQKAVVAHWGDVRVWSLLGLSVLGGVLTLGRSGWAARGILWASYAAGIFFCIYSGGDWMKGYRWFSLNSVPGFTLIAVGIGALARALPAGPYRWPRALYALAPAISLMVPNGFASYKLVMEPETAVRDVHQRVRYMQWVQRRLGIEDVTLLDVDMGAHMYFSDWDIVDIAGLIDVPMARRDYQRAFMKEYLEHRTPTFAHVHGFWAKKSKIPDLPWWKERYLEIPGYPSGGRSLHVGNHVRKDLIVGAAALAPKAADRAASFGPVSLRAWSAPSPEVAPGSSLHLRTWWQAPKGTDHVRVLVFLINQAGEQTVADLAPGYDWYKPERWRAGEVIYGNWDVPLPKSLPVGTYDLGFVVIDAKTGEVLPWEDPTRLTLDVLPPAPPPPRFMAGEVIFPAAVTLVSREEALKLAEADRDAALSDARAGQCEAAREDWRNAKRHVLDRNGWIEGQAPSVDAAVIDCLLADAATEPDLLEKVERFKEARAIDPRSEALAEAVGPVADQLEEKAQKAAASEDWKGAFLYWQGAVEADPTRSWARRAAEEARDKRLGLDGKETLKPEARPAAPGTGTPTRPRVPPGPKRGTPPPGAPVE